MSLTTKAPLISAIDIGTNSFHQVIASVDDRGLLKIIHRDKEVVRLGSSSSDMKYIEDDAIDRGIATLARFAEAARKENAEIRAIATSAVREALNKEEFLKKVKAATGISIEVVSGLEEGRLIFAGALHSLPITAKKTLVIDIGGGSTELVTGNNGEIIYSSSIKMGAIRLTKRFFSDGTVTPQRINDCRSFIIGEWTPTLKRVIETGFESVVGTSGTIVNLAAISLSLRKESTPEILNGLTIEREDFLNTINEVITAKTVKERLKIPGMDPKRADIICGGALIIEQALVALNIQKIIISSYALREGIVYDTIQKKKSFNIHPHLDRLRYESILKVCKKFDCNIPHAEHVKKLSLKLFDVLEPLHKLSFKERELLEAAALMHDIGYFISYEQHHKHSEYLIQNVIISGFTNHELELIANIARYHRKSHPKKKHENFGKLSSDEQKKVMVLASILRVCEGLDRRQEQIITSLTAFFNNKEIQINLTISPNKPNPDIELWGAERRKLLLEEICNKSINFSISERT